MLERFMQNDTFWQLVPTGYALLHLDDAPAASTDPCCQAQDDLDASKPIPTRVTADCCGDVEAS